MRKLGIEVFDDPIADVRPRRRWPLVVAAMILLLGLGPLLLEGASVCLGGWKEVFGVSSTVRTPVFDSLQETVNDLRVQLRTEVAPWFSRIPWDPKMVLPVGALIMAVSMFMLRR
ncbi:hypothetical protein [Aquisphaera insulae]|uniref:hypothetical protein n=1 Tax=Aquisphaera insulae TaxID=2712864 RepID=UPI0013EBED68|nr:hypothetical protein [Aquisphaera insulae]